MISKDLRKKTVQELVKIRAKEEKELLDKKILYTAGKNKDNTVFGKMKRNIARINTLIRQKEILNEQ